MAEIVKYISLSSGDLLPFSVVADDIYVDANYDIEEIVRLINNSVIAPKFRIFVLYSDETIAYEIPTEDIQTGGSYSENYQDGQRRSLSFNLFNYDGKYTTNINKLWVGTKLRLDLGIETNNGLTVWFMKGVYVINQSTPRYSAGEYVVAISAADKFSVFEDKTGVLDSSYEVPEGVLIEDVIREILLHDTGSGEPWDPQPIIYHSSFKGKTVQATIMKNAGETFGSILLELATQLSAEIFYNAAGNLTVIPTNETSMDVDKPLIYSFESLKGDLTGLSFSFNMSDIVNTIVVVGSSINGAVHRATAVNDNAGSPLCVQRMGRRMGNIINDSNITTDLLAQERADYELRKQLILRSSTNVTVMYNPLLNVNNLIAISDEFFDLDHEKFLLQGVSCSLDYSGQMSVTISNIINLPFVTRQM